jgi:hypothetical protein
VRYICGEVGSFNCAHFFRDIAKLGLWLRIDASVWRPMGSSVLGYSYSLLQRD